MIERGTIDSSGSIARDLGLADPEEMDVKAKLAARIVLVARDRDLATAEVARLGGGDESEVEGILDGCIGRVSVFRLIAYLRALDQDVDIIVRPKAAQHAHVAVVSE